MSVPPFRYEDPAHRESVELLPWLVNCTLDDAERERVERHVSQCVTCRRELEAARALQAAVTSKEGDWAATDSLARMHARLLEEEAGLSLQGLRRALARAWNHARLWAQGALVIQFAIIALVGGALAIAFLPARPGPALYHTLGNAAPAVSARSAVAVMFNGERSEHEIRRLLLRMNARVVDGPSPVGVYTLEVRNDQQEAALALLREDPAVAFAEPVPVQRRLPR